MPPVHLVLYAEDEINCPILNWLSEIPDRARDKCLIRMRRLAELGYELRRPESDILRDGIYELRIGLTGVNYRILYFFHGKTVVISHGIVKERVVPPAEIDRAIRNKRKFFQNPILHTHEG